MSGLRGGSPSYFEQAVRDFQALGLYGELFEEPCQWGWKGLFDLLETTQLISPEHFERLDKGNLEVASDLGAKALELLEASAEFSGKEHLQACRSAEPKLIINVSSDSVASTEARSPLVLVRGDEPVGVIKTYGEKSCYGLATDLDIGIIKGCFSQPAHFVELGKVISRLPKTVTAWSLPVEQAGSFVPLRFSAFTIPRDERVKLARNEFAFKHWRRRALVYDHGYVARQAESMLKSAVELDLDIEKLAAAA